MRSVLFFLLILHAANSVADSGDLWLDVPFVKQTENGCGAAVVSMVLQYWNRETGDAAEVPAYDVILKSLYSQSDKGTHAEALQEYLESRGYRVFAFSAEFRDLEHHLSRGRPLIAVLAPEGRDAPLHFVVLTGLASSSSYVMYNDPAERKLLRMKREDFERLREPMNKWTLLALPESAR